ncbi:Aerobic glycerol-3-phosphate dehydrogenase [hydrothermal vent metagenome]|uniref:Aerobic glycerol-3-phosphate dehydrogenase n=1 Tax=hydrothermal vent metagenome TaxID=652676 RepID=A0A3B1B3P6_9ZZZZ
MTKQYDICIIGGGIQGCGVAQAAAAAGHSVLLLEQTGLASATSSRSSKLIHGGLRYLESAQFGLVAESLYERELLIKNAPELVKRVPFYIPIYKHTSRRSWQVFLGLSLYAMLGRLRAEACFRKVPAAKWSQLDGLTEHNLQAVYQYSDAQTDDIQLTRAVMYSAYQLGAELICPAEFIQATYENKQYQIVYSEQETEQTISSRVLINATGPWHNKVQQKISPQINVPKIELVQGAHIIINHAPPRGVYYVESPSDRRAVFVMPWHQQTLIGTTETHYEGDPAKIKPTEHELDYLQNIVHHYFPSYDNNIVNSFAGVRVLPQSEKNMFNRTRDTLYITDPGLPGYVGLMGGKLTGFRSTAEKTMNKIKDVLSDKTEKIKTCEIQMGIAPDSF